MANEKRVYMLRKDGNWLMHIREAGPGIEEFVDGKLQAVPTCLWSADMADAKTFESELEARRLAKLMKAELMSSVATR